MPDLASLARMTENPRIRELLADQGVQAVLCDIADRPELIPVYLKVRLPSIYVLFWMI